jgi:hypothetical protein
MPEKRSLSIRVIIDGRTVQQEDAILATVKTLLEKLPGDPRPTLEIGRASSEAVLAVA